MLEDVRPWVRYNHIFGELSEVPRPPVSCLLFAELQEHMHTEV
jgi:hypothetical protein